MHRCTPRLSVSSRNKLGTVLYLGVLVMGMMACQKQESGPAEHVGKEIDKATVSFGKQVEKAGERIQDAAQGEKP